MINPDIARQRTSNKETTGCLKHSIRAGGKSRSTTVYVTLPGLTLSPGCLQYMTEGAWNWRMMRHIFTELHFYDKEDNYIAFDHKEVEPFYKLQRQIYGALGAR